MCSSLRANMASVIAMEVTHDMHVHEIREALKLTGNPTGVLLQIGTRNTQNFEVPGGGRQRHLPVLLKRGFGSMVGNP